MIVFGPSASPYVRKVLAYASEKGIDLEHRAGGPGSAPDPAFLAASPFRKVPAFQDGDFTVSDSSAIVAYLEKKHPEPALIPEEARAHAKVIWFDEFGDTILTACGVKMFFNRVVAPMLGREGDLAVADKAEKEELPPILAYLEGVIPESGYLVGDTLTLADLSVASPFANLRHMGMEVDADAYPKTAAYVSSILGRDSFAPLIEVEKAMFAARRG